MTQKSSNSNLKFIFLRWLFIILTLQAFLFSEAQKSSKLFFRQLTTEDGLSNESVMVSYQDSYGFIWIGTRNGLNRYDGNQVEHLRRRNKNQLAIDNLFVFDLLQVNKNTLFISTENGLVTFDYRSEQFSLFPNRQLQNLRVHKMAMDLDSSVWVTTENGLFQMVQDSTKAYFNDQTNKFSINSNYSRAVEVDQKYVYVATLSGLNIYDKENRTFQNNQNSDHIAFSKPGEISFGMTKRSNGELWYGSASNNEYVFVNRYNPETGEYSQYGTEENGLGQFYALLSAKEIDGTLYLGMNGDGLYVYNDYEDEFYHFKSDPKNPESLSDPDVWDISSDRSDNLWVGTDGGGLNQSHPFFGRFESFENNPFDSTSLGVNDTYDFFEDDKYVYVGNNTLGLSRLNKKTNTFYNFPFDPENEAKSLLDLTVYAVHGDQRGNVWVGSYSGGLSKLDPTTKNFKHTINERNTSGPLPGNYIREIKSLGNTLWIGTSDGLGKLDLETENIDIIRRTPTQEVFSDVITAIAFDSAGILSITSTMGFFKYDPTTGEIDSTNTFLDSLRCYDLTLKGNTTWIASDKGLIKYNDQNKSLKILSSNDGLSDTKVIGVEMDDLGNLWAITAAGINSIQVATGQINTYHKEDGLLNEQFNIGSLYKGLNGKMYAGGLKGFNRWDPSSFVFSNKEPKVLFSKYTLQQGSEITSTTLLIKDEITLSDDSDYLSIHYFSDEMINEAKTSFAYRLREIDDSWIETKDWKIQLTNLATGKHTLDVKAKNYDGVWGRPSTLKIEVLPPLYATSEAFVLYLLLIIALFFFRDRYLKKQRKILEQTVEDRTMEIRKQKELAEQDKEVISNQNEQISKSLKERESLLKEIHHRVKNNLQIIASLLYLQSGKFKDEDFKKVLEEGQGRVRSMALIHQKLYENEDLKSIPFNEYLNELVNEIRASFGNEMSDVNLNIQAEDVFFDVDTAVPLGLIVNELATNAFKYAFSETNKGSFSIFLTEESGTYTLNIKDNGKGIPEEIDLRKAKSLGLRLVRMLSQQLEGEFEIKNQNGTHFELKFAA